MPKDLDTMTEQEAADLGMKGGLTLAQRIWCPECGSVRMRSRTFRYTVCPNGHGKLVPAFTKADYKMTVVSGLPEATRVWAPAKSFTIVGREGLWFWEAGDGNRLAGPGAHVRNDQVVARYHTPGGLTLVRVFTQVKKKAERTKYE